MPQNILEKIVEQTKLDLKKRKKNVHEYDLNSFEGYEKSRLDFKAALQSDFVSIIAEVKKASPSKGIIREDFDPVSIAAKYQEGGASAISVLTDGPFFKGDLQYLSDISKNVTLPLLRKDFIVDPYQIKEAKAYGADAVLIIVAITEGEQLEELLAAAREFGLHALVECYDQQDFDRVNFDKVEILGVNNRDLKYFEVDVHRGISILKQSPESTILVSESGLSSPDDIAFLHKNGVHSALMGEHFMRQKEPGLAVKDLLLKSRQALTHIISDD
ncbi:MAG TPA: indole-3-glycerol phosphate synthase TrpC [Balneolaceae bacterium]|nr:indole-3-glycerol phosphate synthase TrpC [Balneolaceae bacterium]|tara:strand:+ start:68588 stop:69406 length:819 start_codon:yes stop_codon:yes gene_type:complete